MRELARWGWALLFPPAMMVLLVALIGEGGGIYWVLFGSVMIAGSLAFAFAQWRTWIKLVVAAAYFPLMGIVTLSVTIIAGCYIIGCH